MPIELKTDNRAAAKRVLATGYIAYAMTQEQTGDYRAVEWDEIANAHHNETEGQLWPGGRRWRARGVARLRDV